MDHAHHGHGDCACAAHHGHASAVRRGPQRGALFALFPALACAVCPACLSLYAKVFATLGVGFTFTETQHHWLLLLALAASVLVSAWRSWQSRRAWPVVVSLLGSCLLLSGHGRPGTAWLEYLGVLVLLAGGIRENQRARQPPRSALASTSA